MSKDRLNVYKLKDPGEVSGAMNEAGKLTCQLINSDNISFAFKVTKAETGPNDKLNVFIQTRVAKGMWIDIAHFTQIKGNTDVSKPKVYMLKIAGNQMTEEFEIGDDLSPGQCRNLLGEDFRARWEIQSGTNAIFDFEIVAVPM